MRKVILLMNTTLDGFVAGQGGDLDWTIVDDDMWEYTHTLLSTVDTTLFGRVTYQGFESYWPTVPTDPSSSKQTVEFAHWIATTQKIVFSKTLETVTWNNTKLVKDHVADEILSFKKESGHDIMVMSSPGLVHTLLGLGLIDEFRINVNPILLGSGVPFLKNVDDRTNLKRLSVKPSASGVVGLHYAAPN